MKILKDSESILEDYFNRIFLKKQESLKKK